MSPVAVYLHELGMVSALGDRPEQILARLQSGARDCLTVTDDYSPGTALPVGAVTASLPDLNHFPSGQQTRSLQILRAAWDQIAPAYAAASAVLDPLRIGVVLGTSTSGIAEGEQAFDQWHKTGQWPNGYQYAQQEMIAPVQALTGWAGAKGPNLVISTACSSSAKALASARRWLRMGVCDLVIAGGVDALCQLTVNGFSALDSVARQPSQPFSVHRNGINIGEGAALFLMSREPGPVALVGVGENSDAHHISAPEPNGLGAAAAMQQALQDAGLAAPAIAYLNLHGTGTVQNDKMESLAVATVLGSEVACSSTKPYTGHCLGAAGAIEAAICWLTLRQSAKLPVHVWDGAVDPELAPIHLVRENTSAPELKYAMSNSFAFGGNNISLILGRS